MLVFDAVGDGNGLVGDGDKWADVYLTNVAVDASRGVSPLSCDWRKLQLPIEIVAVKSVDTELKIILPPEGTSPLFDQLRDTSKTLPATSYPATLHASYQTSLSKLSTYKKSTTKKTIQQRNLIVSISNNNPTSSLLDSIFLANMLTEAHHFETDQNLMRLVRCSRQVDTLGNLFLYKMGVGNVTTSVAKGGKGKGKSGDGDGDSGRVIVFDEFWKRVLKRRRISIFSLSSPSPSSKSTTPSLLETLHGSKKMLKNAPPYFIYVHSESKSEIQKVSEVLKRFGYRDFSVVNGGDVFGVGDDESGSWDLVFGHEGLVNVLFYSLAQLTLLLVKITTSLRDGGRVKDVANVNENVMEFDLNALIVCSGNWNVFTWEGQNPTKVQFLIFDLGPSLYHTSLQSIQKTSTSTSTSGAPTFDNQFSSTSTPTPPPATILRSTHTHNNPLPPPRESTFSEITETEITFLLRKTDKFRSLQLSQVIHRRTMLKSLKTLSPCLKLSLSALGAVLTAKLSGEVMIRRPVLEYYYRARKEVLEAVENPSLESLQGLLALYECSMISGVISSGWMLLGMATRMAMLLQLNVDPDDIEEETGEKMFWVEKETRRLLATAFARIPQLEQSNVKSLCSDDIWESLEDPARLEHLFYNPQPESTSLINTFFQFAFLLRKIFTTVFKPDDTAGASYSSPTMDEAARILSIQNELHSIYVRIPGAGRIPLDVSKFTRGCARNLINSQTPLAQEFKEWIPKDGSFSLSW
ncbi:hypothetical protein HDU76_002594, partial [Blyttiomyces sp. JEL0837]